jgi:hypothetical protein
MNLLKHLLLTCFLISLMVGCATNSGIRVNYKTDDLDQNFVNEFKTSSNYFYKFDNKYSVDYMVSLVRMKVFSANTTKNTGEILLSFGTIGREKSFDCNLFFSKLTAKEKDILESRMEGHPFVCRKAAYTAKDVLASFPIALSDKIETPRVADSHWAWFGATGDTEPLKRLLDNFLYNPKACLRCIEWSYPSNAKQNSDVEKYLVEYMSQKTEKEKERLSSLLPK